MNKEHDYQHQMEKLEATNAILLEVAEQVVREYEDGLGNMPKDIYEGAVKAVRKAKESDND